MNNNIYEIGFLINPDLAQQGAEKAVENVKNIIQKASASVISEGEIVDMDDLAYPIITKIASKNERFDKAYFTWVKFESETSKLEVIKKEIDKIKKEVFRYLIIKTVKNDEETDKFLSISEDESESEDVSDIDSEENDITDEEVNTEVKEEEKTSEDEESDDLTKIEGIGPKTAEVLNSKNIKTFSDLADSKVEDLRNILDENGLKRYDPKSWPKQSRLARDEKWEELVKLQDELDGGE